MHTQPIISSSPSSREIPLSRGCTALVDADDYERVAALKWHCTDHGYAARGGGGCAHAYMHRFILGIADKRCVDHISGNKLDNRRQNLRIASPSLNGLNRHRLNKNSTSGIRGVYWNKQKHKWAVKANPNRRQVHLGFFDSKEDARAISHGAFGVLALHSRGVLMVTVEVLNAEP